MGEKLPRKVTQLEIRDCSDFEIIDDPIKGLLDVNPQEFGKYSTWLKFSKCSVKLNKDPKMTKHPTGDTPILDEARIVCQLNDLTIKDQDEKNKSFYDDNLSLMFIENPTSNTCHSFLKFHNADDSIEKKHYMPSKVHILIPKTNHNQPMITKIKHLVTKVIVNKK